MLDGEEGLEYEVCVDGIHLEHVLEFKYLECVLDESGSDEGECSGRRVAGAINSLWLRLGVCYSMLELCTSHCLCLFLRMVARMIWMEKERSRIKSRIKSRMHG